MSFKSLKLSSYYFSHITIIQKLCNAVIVHKRLPFEFHWMALTSNDCRISVFMFCLQLEDNFITLEIASRESESINLVPLYKQHKKLPFNKCNKIRPYIFSLFVWRIESHRSTFEIKAKYLGLLLYSLICFQWNSLNTKIYFIL